MKTIRTITLTAMAVLLTSAAMASPVSPKRAAAVAHNFFGSLCGAKSTLQDLSKEWPYDGMYLFVGSQGGFVLVAADDAARPILGYSPSGSLDPQNLPTPLQQWLRAYQQEINALREAKSTPCAAYAPEWYALENNLMPKDSVSGGVEPLLTTHWDQGYPYNGYCPRGTVTGCAATAQAQIMNYWQHPAFGQGSHSYTHATYGLQQADFAHTLYDWNNMPDQATSSTPMEQKEAVAVLMYHCGVSLEMGYGTAAQGGSMAAGLAGMPGFASIDNSLKDYFCYSPDMRVVFKDNGYTNERWRDQLIAELDQRRPVVYTGAAAQGGHGFVCDGYDHRGYLHFNFGWSGVGDGYFPVDSISPGVGGAGGNGTYTFNMNNSALLGLVPDYRLRVSDTAFSIPRQGGADSLLLALNDTVRAPWTMLQNDADWLTLQADSFSRAGWIRFQAQENNTGRERVAYITFVQGDQQCTVRVAQAAYDPEEMCPLTVVMECTRGNGWQGGAYLSLESAGHYVYGTAALQGSTRDSVVILVAPSEVYSVFHPGGGTDRYINYYVRNQYGEDCVSVEYAYRNGGTHLLQWPCAHLGIADTPAPAPVEVDPNPATTVLNIQADGLQKVELMDMGGRRIITTTQPQLNIGQLPRGAYFVRITTANSTTVKRVVKK